MILDLQPLPLCACGAVAVFFAPGHDAEISEAADIMVKRGHDTTGKCLKCNSVKEPHMVERVRAAPKPGDNVTDETRVEALASLTATFNAQREASEEARVLKAEHADNLKRWKARGIRLNPIKKVIKERFEDPADVLADLHEETRLRALTNMPNIQQDLVALWAPVEVPEDKKAELDRMRWRDDGAFAGREGQPRDRNPHQAGSDAYDCWDRGWLEDQTRIAKAMADGTEPHVDTSKAKPARAPKVDTAPTPPKTPRKPRGEAAAVH